DIKVLVVIYPREISDGAQYAIDQFILRGGKLVAFLDPLSIADNRNSNPSNPLQSAMSGGATMDKLLKAWGIEFDISKAVADMTYKTNIRGQDGRAPAAAAVLSLTKDAINADGVVILVGDSDMIFDPVCVQVQNIFGQKIVIPQNGNLNLAQSMVEQLAGDSNLISVRSRATLNRPFTVVKKMEERAQESYRSK